LTNRVSHIKVVMIEEIPRVNEKGREKLWGIGIPEGLEEAVWRRW
jgi:hypothetical protein